MAKETTQQYMSRVSGYLAGKKPLAVQAATHQKLSKLIKGVPAPKLKKRPAPDKWSVAEIVAHLADCEIVAGWRMRLILGSPGTPILGFNQDAWAEAGHYSKRDTRKSLAEFKAFRDANLALLKSLKPEQWKHHGMHSERGVETIERIAVMFAGHDLNHIMQIEQILGKGKSSRA